MNKEIYFILIARAFLFFLMAVLVLVSPWWISVLITLIIMFYLSPYYEVLFLALLADSLYGAFAVFPLIFTLISAIILYLIVIARNRMRW